MLVVKKRSLEAGSLIPLWDPETEHCQVSMANAYLYSLSLLQDLISTYYLISTYILISTYLCFNEVLLFSF